MSEPGTVTPTRWRRLWACALVAALAACSSSTTSPVSGAGEADEPTPVGLDVEADPAAPDVTEPPAGAQPSPDDDQRIAAIERAINETEAAQHECWAFAAVDDFRLRGTIVLRLTFGDQQQVAAVEVTLDEPRDERLRACISELFQQYRWPAVFQPGQAIELPLSFKAPRGQYTVAARYVADTSAYGGGAQATVLMHERNTGNGAGGMALLTMTEQADSGLHWHNSATEILYVLAGDITVYGVRGRKRGQRLTAGQAAYIAPGTAHGTYHAAGARTRLVQFFTPDGPQRSFLSGRAIDTVQVTEAERKRRLRQKPATPIVVRTPTAHKIAGGRAQVDFFFEEAKTGHKAAYMGILTAQPGVRVPSHRHARESEYLYIVQGSGSMTVADDSYPIGDRTAVQIPANTEHAVTVAGETPLIAVQFYTPSGPEQRFKQPKK